jgi:hypothetical protein
VQAICTSAGKRARQRVNESNLDVVSHNGGRTDRQSQYGTHAELNRFAHLSSSLEHDPTYIDLHIVLSVSTQAGTDGI